MSEPGVCSQLTCVGWGLTRPSGTPHPPEPVRLPQGWGGQRDRGQAPRGRFVGRGAHDGCAPRNGRGGTPSPQSQREGSGQCGLRLSRPRAGAAALTPHAGAPHAVRGGSRVGTGQGTCSLPHPRPPAAASGAPAVRPARTAEPRPVLGQGRGGRGCAFPPPDSRVRSWERGAPGGAFRAGHTQGGPAEPWTRARPSALDSGSQKLGKDSGEEGQGPRRVCGLCVRPLNSLSLGRSLKYETGQVVRHKHSGVAQLSHPFWRVFLS